MNNNQIENLSKPILKGAVLPESIDIQAGILNAYQTKDPTVSKALHQAKRALAHTENHSSSSKEWLKIAVFGGLDGIVTIFCVMAGCAGASLSTSQIIVIGIGNLLGDAISMGFGEYTSAKAEEEFESVEIEREAWEMRHCPDDEISEMIDLYQTKWGMDPEDANAIVEITWKYPEFFLNHMMVEELDMLVQPDGMNSRQKGLLMAVSFLVFGSVPLATYSLSNIFFSNAGFSIACFAAALALFILGTIKSALILEGFGTWRAMQDGILMLANGSVAGIIAYTCGNVLQNAVQSYHTS